MMATPQQASTQKKQRKQLRPQKEDAAKFAQLSAAFVNENDLEAAEGAAEFAVAADKASFDAWLMLGVCRARKKNYEPAVPCYVKALELRPDDVAAWCDLGELFTLMMDYDRAAAALRQAMTLDPNADHPSGRRARAIVGRTLAMLKKK